MQSEYLEELKKTENIIFLPTVGSCYGKEGSFFKNQKKLLILGESFYCLKMSKVCGGICSKNKVKQKKDCLYGACKIVHQEYVKARNNGDHNPWCKSFLACEKSYFGYEPDPQQRIQFWNSVSFYNFFTEPQKGPSRNLEFSPETWERSKKAFIDVINILRPDAVICWGRRAWNCMPDFGERRSDINTEELKGEVWFYPFKDSKEGTPVLLHNPHPSRPRGNSFNRWHKVYKIFLKDFYASNQN